MNAGELRSILSDCGDGIPVTANGYDITGAQIDGQPATLNLILTPTAPARADGGAGTVDDLGDPEPPDLGAGDHSHEHDPDRSPINEADLPPAASDPELVHEDPRGSDR